VGILFLNGLYSQENGEIATTCPEDQVQGLSSDIITALPTDTEVILRKKFLMIREQNKQLQAQVSVLQKSTQQKVQEVVVLRNYSDAVYKNDEQLLKNKESIQLELTKMQLDNKKLLEACEA